MRTRNPGHLVASLLVAPALPFTLPWASDSLPVLFPPPSHEAGCGWEEGLRREGAPIWAVAAGLLSSLPAGGEMWARLPPGVCP